MKKNNKEDDVSITFVEHELQKYELQMGQEKAEKLENFIKEEKELDLSLAQNQIELKFINDPAYLGFLRLQGVDVERINEPEYRSFLESKGVKFLTEEMSIEKEKAVKLKQEQEKVEKLENVIKEGFIQAQKESEKELDFGFTKNQIELKFINDPAYLSILESKGVDVGRINEPEYRSFLESKGVKFKVSEEFIISNHSITESEDQSSTLIGSDIIQEESFH